MTRTLLFLLVLIPLPALASGTLDDAVALYNEGDFTAAADAAEGLDTADGYALAARALLAEAAYKADPDRGRVLLERALEVSRRALFINPYHIEGMLQRIIALGYKARIMGDWPAHNAGLGYETEKLLKRAEAVAPDEPWVAMVRGGWEAEVLSGGGLFSHLFYAVSEEEAFAAFERAINVAPDNPVFRVEYARGLLRLDSRNYADVARQQLETAAMLAPANAFETLVKAQGNRLLAALDSGDSEQLRATLRDEDAFRQ